MIRRRDPRVRGSLEDLSDTSSVTPLPSQLPRQAEPVSGRRASARPSILRRAVAHVEAWRRMFLPLPDELIDRYLGHGEQKIHSDHPSFRAFLITNGLLVVGLLAGTALFLTFSFNGSALASLLIGLLVVGLALALFIRRLSEAYTSYVITNVRIIRLSGVISRRMHSIPWVRVTDLSMEQGLIGRLFGYATVHIESANEDSGLRDLRGVSDPVRFHSYLVDIVVAKQGSLDVELEERPASGGLGQRLRRARARVRDRARSGAQPSPSPGSEPTQVIERGVRHPADGDPYYADRRQVIVGPPDALAEQRAAVAAARTRPSEPGHVVEPVDPAELAEIAGRPGVARLDEALVEPVDEFVDGLLGGSPGRGDGGDDTGELRRPDGR